MINLTLVCFSILNKHSTTNYSFKYWEEKDRNQQHKKAHTEVTNSDCRNSARDKGTGPHTKQLRENKIFKSYSLSKYHPPCAVNESVEKLGCNHEIKDCLKKHMHRQIKAVRAFPNLDCLTLQL